GAGLAIETQLTFQRRERQQGRDHHSVPLSAGHFISAVARASGQNRRMRTLERARNYAGVTNLPEAAVVGKALFGPGTNQDVESFLVTRLRLFDGDAEPVVQPSGAAAPPAL